MKQALRRHPVLFLIVLVLLFPWPTLEAPNWTVRVVDSQERPVTDADVRESYQDYSAEMNGHEERLQTGADGMVHFRAHRVWHLFVMRVVVTSWRAMALAHASFGVHAGVFAFGDGGLQGDIVDGNYVYDWRGSPAVLTSEIHLKPLPAR